MIFYGDKNMKRDIATALLAGMLVSTACAAYQGHMKVERTPDTVGGIESTVIETWSVDEEEDDYYCCSCDYWRK